ncbi:MAG: T9SS type A sorting domain-containing protein, partial [Ignavibacteriaceae bacterium]
VKSYNWEIPVIESKNCKIRIVDVDDNAHADTSDGVFEIYNPKLTVTSPNGGEIWRTNTTNKITWTSSEINEVKIEYSTNDGFSWKVISNSLAASLGSIDWIIPAERTSRAKVRVTDISFASTSDTSDNSFTILFPEISLTAPVGGENWKTNTVQQIKWSSSDIENISIEYSTDNGTSWFLINNSILASSGIYNWTIPRTPTDQAKVRVSDVNYKEINAVSNTFTIIKPLALLTPRGGEKWFSGSVQQVNWNFNFVDSVKLEYSLNNGASWQLIANSLPATLLVYDWHIPPNINSTQCRVKITDRNNIFTADSSGDVFTIIDPTLTVLTPNGGENLKGDTEYQITWKNQNSDSLAIDYSTNNGTTWTLITKACNAKAEKFTWVIPKVTSTQCLMRITDKNYLTVSDTSDEVFSIYTPQITLLSPKGGEIWYVGETKQIKWQSSFVEKVKIELTTTNGNVWSTLASAVNAADSSYTLFIENIPSVACRIKVSADEDSKIVDSSRSNFSIVILPPSIQVSIYQNPVLTQYCNVVLVSDSLLSALPTTEVWRIGDTEIPVYEMKPIPNSVYVYECSIRFDTTGIYNVASKIISRMGIERDTVRQFSVGMILPNLFASIKSKDGGLTLSINPGVVEEITFISVEEEKVNKEIIYRLQPEKTFKKAINLKLSFANASFEETYKLSIFTFVDGEWRAIPSEVNVKEKTVSASLTTFGKVKLGIDVNKKEKIDLPQTFALIQNYPNPFNPSTVITFHLPEDCDASIEIYNMLGAKISTLRSGFALAGRYSVTWEGLNDAKIQVPSGIYLYRLKTNKFDQVRKMIFLK